MKLILILTLSLHLFSSPLAADFGLRFVTGDVTAIRLDQPQAKLAFRFQAPFDTDLQAVALHCDQTENSPAYMLSVFKDNHGKPASNPLAQASIVPKAKSWSLMTMDEETLPLIAGQTYFLVIGWDEKRGVTIRWAVSVPTNGPRLPPPRTTTLFMPTRRKPI